MKVICKNHKNCMHPVHCPHSTPHDLTSGWSGLNSVYNCNEHFWCDNCDCDSTFIRKEKLKKINDSTLQKR